MVYGCRPLATAYLSESRNRIIVCPTTSPDSGGVLYVELPPSAVLTFDVDTEQIGRALWDALLSFRIDSRLGSGKWTDSPPYQASGCKSVRLFREEFVVAKIEAFPCVLRIEATIPRPTAEGMFLGREITNACEFEELGDLMQLLVRCALHAAEFDFP